MKPPCLMLPGTLCTRQIFAEQEGAIHEIAESLIHLPLKGSSLGECAEAILGLAPQRFALLGFSLGGLVALEIMRRAPDRVSSLCLIATNPRGSTPQHFELWSRWKKEVESGGFEEVVRAHAAGVYTQNAKAASLVTKMALELGPSAFTQQLNILESRPESLSTLATITCRTLLIVGIQDQVTPLYLHQEMQRLVPGATLETLPNCGHYAPIERPRAVSTLLHDWLQA